LTLIRKSTALIKFADLPLSIAGVETQLQEARTAQANAGTPISNRRQFHPNSHPIFPRYRLSFPHPQRNQPARLLLRVLPTLPFSLARQISPNPLPSISLRRRIVITQIPFLRTVSGSQRLGQSITNLNLSFLPSSLPSTSLPTTKISAIVENLVDLILPFLPRSTFVRKPQQFTLLPL